MFKDKVNYKYYDGEEFKLYQDITVVGDGYSNKHITFTIPLCDVNREKWRIIFWG